MENCNSLANVQEMNARKDVHQEPLPHTVGMEIFLGNKLLQVHIITEFHKTPFMKLDDL